MHKRYSSGLVCVDSLLVYKKGSDVSPDVNVGYHSWSDNSVDIRAFTKLGMVIIICHGDSIPLLFQFSKVIGLFSFKL